MKLHVSFGDSETNEWRTAAAIEPNAEPTHGPGTHNWKVPISLPSGEAFEVGAVFAEGNRGVNIVVSRDGIAFISVGGFKQNDTAYDPTLTFLSPGGLQVRIMLGA